jgi:hypothetical protein
MEEEETVGGQKSRTSNGGGGEGRWPEMNCWVKTPSCLHLPVQASLELWTFEFFKRDSPEIKC